MVLIYEATGALHGVCLTHSMLGAKMSRRQHKHCVTKIIDVQQLTELEEADERLR